MNRMRKWIAWGLCVLLAATILVPQNVQATNPGSAETTDIVAGVDTDISISNVNVDGDRAGEKITVSFRAGADTVCQCETDRKEEQFGGWCRWSCFRQYEYTKTYGDRI